MVAFLPLALSGLAGLFAGRGTTGSALVEISPGKGADLSKKEQTINTFAPQTTTLNLIAPISTSVSGSPNARVGVSPAFALSQTPSLTPSVSPLQTGSVLPSTTPSTSDNLLFYGLLIGGGYIIYEQFFSKKRGK